jgi:hypothetical protein
MGSSYYHSTAVSGGCTGGGIIECLKERRGGGKRKMRLEDLEKFKEKLNK